MLSMFILLAVSYAEANWQKISSNTMQYTAHYPQEGWGAKIDYQQQDVPEYVIIERALFWNKLGAEIAIDVWEDRSNMTISQWIDAHESIFTFKSDELQKGIVTVERIDALHYQISVESCEAYASQETYFKQGNHVFRISYLEVDQGASNDVYQHLIDTFEFGVPLQMTLQLSKAGKIDILPSVDGHNDCGGQQHCSSCCGATNSLAICCSYKNGQGYHSGNCVWWAWQQSCRIWKDAVPHAGNGKTWARSMRAHGYHVSSTPAPNTIACWDRGTKYGHVAWVKEVRGNKVLVSEMACSSWYGVRDHEYPISYFDEGFIYPKGQVPGVCGKPDVTLTSYSGSDCPAGRTLTLKAGFSTSGKAFRGYIR